MQMTIFRSSFVTIVIIIIIPLRWWNCIHCCGIRHRIEDKRQDAWIINKCELYNHTQHSLPSSSSVWILIFSFSSSNAAVAVWNSSRTSISGFFLNFVSFLSFDFGQFVSWNLWHSRESDAQKLRESFLFSRTQSKRHRYYERMNTLRTLAGAISIDRSIGIWCDLLNILHARNAPPNVWQMTIFVQ